MDQKAIARVLGVNQSTISRALSGSPEVSPEIRRRIQEYARRVGYQPSYIGRSFSSQRTQVISLLRPGSFEFSETQSQLLSHLQVAIRDNGYRLRLDHLSDYKTLEAEGSADAFIVVGEWENRIEPVVGARPIVYLDCEPVPGLPPVINLHNEEGGRLAAECLLSKGHTMQCFFGLMVNSRICTARYKGWLEAIMESGGMGFHVDMDGWPTRSSQVRAIPIDRVTSLMGLGVTAFFCPSDTIAIGLINILRVFGCSVPTNASVVGYNDMSVTEDWDPPITTIRQPLKDAAEAAVSRVLAAIRGLPAPDPPPYAPVLIERGSVATLMKP